MASFHFKRRINGKNNVHITCNCSKKTIIKINHSVFLNLFNSRRKTRQIERASQKNSKLKEVNTIMAKKNDFKKNP